MYLRISTPASEPGPNPGLVLVFYRATFYPILLQFLRTFSLADYKELPRKLPMQYVFRIGSAWWIGQKVENLTPLDLDRLWAGG